MFGERSPIWDTDARGVFFGLSLASTKADMVRAIMEGAAFGLRHNLAAAAAAGFRARTLACVGGGARSPVWNQLKADITGMPIVLPGAATGAPLGDALAAGVGTGVYPGFAEAVARIKRVEREFRPDAVLAERYDRLYRIYSGLYPALRTAFHDLAAVDDD
jgi:xylulokinase